MAHQRILIVDDDQELCEQLAEALEINGYPSTHTSDPQEGKRFINEDDFDIVILDYKMSGLTGIDLLKIAKDKRPASKVFIVSGRPFIEKLLLQEKVAHLVSEVITKPFDVDALFQKLKVHSAIHQ